MTLDGDEAVVGLMARHLCEGRRPAVFFYGQRYGLALVEAGAGATFFAAFGESIASLKAAMLVIWALGWLFAVLTVRRLWGNRAAVVAAALLATCPAWGAWSMKARGGYVTAFAFAQAAVWLTATSASACEPLRRLRALALGLCAGVVFLAQPFWLPAMAPHLWRIRRRWSSPGGIAAAALGLLVVVVPAYLLSPDESSNYWLPPTFSRPDGLFALKQLPYRVWAHFTGAYFINARYADAGGWIDASGWLWSAALAWLLTSWVLHRRTGAVDPFQRACLLSALATLALSLFVKVDWFGFRYLLPMSAFAAMAAAGELSRRLGGASGAGGSRAAAAIVLAAMLVAGAGAGWQFRKIPFDGTSAGPAIPERRAQAMLVESLLADGIHHVYVEDPLLQWNIMFASGGRITARWKDPRDRRPEYPRRVDAALRAGEPVALVDDVWKVPPDEVEEFLRVTGHVDLKPRVVADRFFVLPGVTEDLIRATDFRLGE